MTIAEPKRGGNRKRCGGRVLPEAAVKLEKPVGGRAAPGTRTFGISRDALIIAVILLSASASFGLGMLAGRESREGEKGAFWIEDLRQEVPAAVDMASSTTEEQDMQQGPAQADVQKPATPAAGGAYVASKTGTKYYLPWCGTASRIKEENRVWFATKAEAEAAGYEPAKNCKGI